MKLQENIHGFTVTGITPVKELDGTLYEMVYDKNGAKLLYFDRADSNKTFAITFKTIPSDDTGVFHILEHSVLNGSDKYPVKEPFVELLKGSLQTFLNAFTYPDRTMYPVCSRNDKDFMNLMDVYMDAVLHPLILSDPNIFKQEGWRFEIDHSDDALTYNGVVFNEMKGVFSSVDSVISRQLNHALYPDTCYACESGGDPVYIPDLTYEQFVDCHKRFYHPSNARIFLDGTMDLPAVLSLLDGYLSKYDRLTIDTEIPMQKTLPYHEITKEYEISPEEDPAGKTMISFGYHAGTFSDKEKTLAVNILADVLAGTNESPLTKAILEKELGQDVNVGIRDGLQQNYAAIYIRNTDAEKLPEIRETIRQVLSSLAENGIDRSLLNASFNSFEFRMREKDFGAYPAGLIYGMSAMETWLYGGNPVQNLENDAAFASLRRQMEDGYFEKLLKTCFLDNPHKAAVIATPSKTLGEERRKEEADKLAKIKESMTEEQLQALISQSHAFKAWQAKEDTPEQLATLPQLSLSDIPEKPEKIPFDVTEENGIKVIRHTTTTSGILYADLYFSTSGLTAEELSMASFLCDLLCRTDTDQSDSYTLQNKIKENLGNLDVSPEVYTKNGVTDSCLPYLTVSCSMLESKTKEALQLIDEVLNHSRFDNRTVLCNILRQRKMNLESSITSSGHSYAVMRVSAYNTSYGAVNEYFGGLESYFWAKDKEKNFDSIYETLAGKLSALCKKIFTKERLILSLTGDVNKLPVAELIRLIPSANEIVPACQFPSFGVRQEGFVIPAAVSFAAMGANLYQIGAPYTGSMRVAKQLLSLCWLWNEIRVKGGAYGGGFSTQANGSALFYSYRDPNAVNSLDVYAKSGEYLKAFSEGNDDLTKFIIGTIAESEPLLTPRSAGKRVAVRYLTGFTFADECRLRYEILHTTKEQIGALQSVFDAIAAKNAVCVIGGKDKLDACGSRLTSVRNI